MPEVIKVRDEVRTRCEGKVAMLFVGGSRAHHYQELFREIGMKTISAGYEFAHRDDYEGRNVLPFLKVDADSRNIEELEVHPDPERFRPRKTAEDVERLQAQGFRFKDYDGMMREMPDKTLVIDDISQYETRAAHRHLQTGHFLCRHQGEIRRPEEGHPHEAAPQLRFRRPVRGLQGSHQFLPGD